MSPQHKPAIFDPALVTINRKRFSDTQGEVEVCYDGRRLEQFGDKIVLDANGHWTGYPDSVWIAAAAQYVAKERAKAAGITNAAPQPALVKYVCPNCSGDNCGHHANSVWDIATQAWTLSGSYENGWCSDCGDVDPLALPLTPEEARRAAGAPFETRSVIVLSTVHLAAETLSRLNHTNTSDWPVCGAQIPHGFYIYAHDSNEGDEIPSDLWACLSVARVNGFDYVQFDCDANVLDGLPVYEH